MKKQITFQGSNIIITQNVFKVVKKYIRENVLFFVKSTSLYIVNKYTGDEELIIENLVDLNYINFYDVNGANQKAIPFIINYIYHLENFLNTVATNLDVDKWYYQFLEDKYLININTVLDSKSIIVAPFSLLLNGGGNNLKYHANLWINILTAAGSSPTSAFTVTGKFNGVSYVDKYFTGGTTDNKTPFYYINEADGDLIVKTNAAVPAAPYNLMTFGQYKIFNFQTLI